MHTGAVLFHGDTYLNCYDPVKYYYDKGVRLFELDVEYTTDDKPVMLHSWDGFQWKYMGLDRDKVYSYDEFNNATMIKGYTQLNVERTIKYMREEFPEMFWITDTKNVNEKLLTSIANEYPDIMDRIIPQIYNQDEYFMAQKLGFNNIIYTLYMSEDTDEQVIDFCKENNVFAITMPLARAQETNLANDLKEIGVYVYTHTVNDDETYEAVKQKGVQGIYTDTLF